MICEPVGIFIAVETGGLIFSPTVTHYCAVPDSATLFCAMGEREREILRLACLSLKDVADATGIAYGTVRNWSAGRIEMSAEGRLAVALFFREHGAKLVKLAEELEG